MNRLIVIHVPLVIALLFLVRPGSSGTEAFKASRQHAETIAGQTDSEWLLLAPEHEEFSVMTPAPPGVMTRRGDYSFEVGGEKVLEGQAYSGYANGFVFVIESYRASHPQKIFKPIVHNATTRASFERDAMVDGYTGQEYRGNSAPSYISRIFCLVAKQHVYVLTLAARDERNTLPERFLSSFKLRDQSVTRTHVESQLIKGDRAAAVEVVSTREVTRKVAVVWKPEPSYTEQARRHQLTGTIVLQAIFAADGQVTNIEVLSGLKDGLTEKAIEAARNVRFFPAEKDGRLVSQRLNLEYNFNLY